MNNLPYIQPEQELFYNLGVALIILEKLSASRTGKKILTLEKFQIFYFLTTKPIFASEIISGICDKTVERSHADYFTVSSISQNVDFLFDRKQISIVIKTLAAKGLLSVEYCEKSGFLFGLSEYGIERASSFNSGYFPKVRGFVENLLPLRSKSPSSLNSHINLVLKNRNSYGHI